MKFGTAVKLPTDLV